MTDSNYDEQKKPEDSIIDDPVLEQAKAQLPNLKNPSYQQHNATPETEPYRAQDPLRRKKESKSDNGKLEKIIDFAEELSGE